MAYISKGLRGGKVLICGGYRYHKNIETNNKIWWRCWRKTCRASLSTNIFDLKDDNPIIEYRTWKGKTFLSLLDNNWGLAVFTISRNLKTLAKCHTVYIDGTFRTSPAPYFQLVTIHGYFRDRIIPLVFCLLNGKQVGQ
jgi:hypothetical protein